MSLDQVNDSIEKTSYTKLGKKIMVCHLTLVNGHEVIGQAGVVNAKLFDASIGKRISYENALNEVWSHLGGVLQNSIAEEE